MLSRIEKIFASNRFVSSFLRRSKSIYPPGFEGIPLFAMLRFLHRQVKTIGITERAAAISYNFIMSLPPSFLFFFTLIPYLPFIPMPSLRIQLHSLIYDIVPGREYNTELIKFVDSFMEGTQIGILSSGLLLSLFFASNAVMGLMRAFNKNYTGFEQRKGLRRRWMAIKLTMLMFGLLLVYLFLLIMQGNLLALIVEDSRWREVISYGRWVLMIVLVFFAIAFIYKYAPGIQKGWKLFSPGTIIATVLSLISSFGFSVFVNNFGRYNALYGSISIIMVLMALIYINSLVLLIGFEINVGISTLKGEVSHLKT
ncbi:MAG: YihY/virulence factor BrkB family protein [Ferruginibacter sp.]